MSAGYGRGYYGVEQRAPRRAPARPWVKIGVIAGVGAAIWLLWPRSKQQIHCATVPKDPLVPSVEDPQQTLPFLPSGSSAPSAPAVHSVSAAHSAPSAPLAFEGARVPQLTQEAHARGFPSQEAYEETIVSNARQLRETGATVSLAPHLRHLTPRLGAGA